MILDRLEESVSEQSELDQRSMSTDRDEVERMKTEEEEEEQAAATAADGRGFPGGLDAAEIRKFFSARNLKTVRNDPSRKNFSCFGRRMDRIGSMSSFGCNSVSKYGEWQFHLWNTQTDSMYYNYYK